jgi:hypothetical protein
MVKDRVRIRIRVRAIMAGCDNEMIIILIITEGCYSERHKERERERERETEREKQ